MLIFLPDKRGSNPFHLVEAGLSYLDRPGDHLSYTDLESTGPGGKPGVIAGWIEDRPTPDTELFGYAPQRQTWIESANGKYWVGWQNDRPPSPATLARREMIDGPRLELGDGNEWQLIAAARLPQQARLISGNWEWAPQQRFASFVERTAWAFDVARKTLESGAGIPIEAVDYAMGVLSWNYRITPEIADRLGLFTAEVLFHLLATTSDMKRLVEIQDTLKKTAKVET